MRPVSRLVCAIGGCFFLAGFFIQGVDGLGRAIGLCGISIFIWGVVVNLVLEATGHGVKQHSTRHLVTQALIASVVAFALLWLAAYVYQHGVLPSFMPTRYESVPQT